MKLSLKPPSSEYNRIFMNNFDSNMRFKVLQLNALNKIPESKYNNFE